MIHNRKLVRIWNESIGYKSVHKKPFLIRKTHPCIAVTIYVNL